MSLSKCYQSVIPVYLCCCLSLPNCWWLVTKLLKNWSQSCGLVVSTLWVSNCFPFYSKYHLLICSKTDLIWSVKIKPLFSLLFNGQVTSSSSSQAETAGSCLDPSHFLSIFCIYFKIIFKMFYLKIINGMHRKFECRNCCKVRHWLHETLMQCLEVCLLKLSSVNHLL